MRPNLTQAQGSSGASHFHTWKLGSWWVSSLPLTPERTFTFPTSFPGPESFLSPSCVVGTAPSYRSAQCHWLCCFTFSRMTCPVSHWYWVLCYAISDIKTTVLSTGYYLFTLPPILQLFHGCMLACLIDAFSGSTWRWVCPSVSVLSLLIQCFITFHASSIPERWHFC